jgi:excisionase family DNA binding protein
MVIQRTEKHTLKPPSWDVEEAASLLKVSPRTLRRMAERREIAHFRVGRRLLFSDHDIAEFLTKSRVSAEH